MPFPCNLRVVKMVQVLESFAPVLQHNGTTAVSKQHRTTKLQQILTQDELLSWRELTDKVKFVRVNLVEVRQDCRRHVFVFVQNQLPVLCNTAVQRSFGQVLETLSGFEFHYVVAEALRVIRVVKGEAALKAQTPVNKQRGAQTVSYQQRFVLTFQRVHTRRLIAVLQKQARNIVVQAARFCADLGIVKLDAVNRLFGHGLLLWLV